MVPVLGLFAAAAVVGAGAAVGWRVARDHILPALSQRPAMRGGAGHPRVIDGDYVEVRSEGTRSGGAADRAD